MKTININPAIKFIAIFIIIVAVYLQFRTTEGFADIIPDLKGLYVPTADLPLLTIVDNINIAYTQERLKKIGLTIVTAAIATADTNIETTVVNPDKLRKRLININKYIDGIIIPDVIVSLINDITLTPNLSILIYDVQIPAAATGTGPPAASTYGVGLYNTTAFTTYTASSVLNAPAYPSTAWITKEQALRVVATNTKLVALNDVKAQRDALAASIAIIDNNKTQSARLDDFLFALNDYLDSPTWLHVYLSGFTVLPSFATDTQIKLNKTLVEQRSNISILYNKLTDAQRKSVTFSQFPDIVKLYKNAKAAGKSDVDTLDAILTGLDDYYKSQIAALSNIGTDNTLMYVGIGVGVAVLVGGGLYFMMSRPAAPAGAPVKTGGGGMRKRH